MDDIEKRRHDTTPRDALADRRLLAHSERMTMPERLEHALAWNKLASELREGVKAVEAARRNT